MKFTLLPWLNNTVHSLKNHDGSILQINRLESTRNLGIIEGAFHTENPMGFWQSRNDEICPKLRSHSSFCVN